MNSNGFTTIPSPPRTTRIGIGSSRTPSGCGRASATLHVARRLTRSGLTVHYPGLETHPQHDRLRRMMNPGYGYGGMLTLDAGTAENANRLMTRMQEVRVGYLAVSLGYFKTSVQLPRTQHLVGDPAGGAGADGAVPGAIRFSVGLDNDIDRTVVLIEQCLAEIGLVQRV